MLPVGSVERKLDRLGGRRLRKLLTTPGITWGVGIPPESALLLGPDGDAEPLPIPEGRISDPRFSPDGRAVAYSAFASEASRGHVYTYHFELGGPTQVSFEGARDVEGDLTDTMDRALAAGEDLRDEAAHLARLTDRELRTALLEASRTRGSGYASCSSPPGAAPAADARRKASTAWAIQATRTATSATSTISQRDVSMSSAVRITRLTSETSWATSSSQPRR